MIREKAGFRGDTSAVEWRKSTKSGPYSDNCVESAQDGELFLMRDSKDPDGAVLTFTRPEWDAFILGAKDGEFDYG